MNIDQFRTSLTERNPPVNLSTPLQALWHEGKGQWEKAHATVQDDKSKEAAWVHAHLHRKEGDQGNADYWYARAGRKSAHGSPDAEWEHIVRSLLDSP